ncbi:hypothetical protein GCM10009804_58460 [Kribbella hippodromi]|uniref:Tetracyclin repressor-like C-terminal domain-containing protein n=2 Tax=Kribbella hippodromi TaxID=434347 RepID=A0ABN2E4X0_9ACTN
MEGIAAEAGVGKQTLYRSWQSVPAILFDALLARSKADAAPTPPDESLPERLRQLLEAAVEEMTTEPNATLLRTLAAAIQLDELTAREYRERLLKPQLNEIHQLLRDADVPFPPRTTELLLAPVFYRWSMRLPPMNPNELSLHINEVLALTQQP